MLHTLPIPEFVNPSGVADIRRIDYAGLHRSALEWAASHGVARASQDTRRIAFLGIDLQNTFCHPDFELFVGGRTGRGALEDTVRASEFLYRNLSGLTELIFTLDTHGPFQIFHPMMLIDQDGNTPNPAAPTVISHADVVSGKWLVNPHSIYALLGEREGREKLQRHLEYYTAELERRGKYQLTIWPYHAMFGGIGHALTPMIEEAAFFHSIARGASPRFEVKGREPLTEFYSVYSPEITTMPDGTPIGSKRVEFLDRLLEFDAVVVAGQAKSHCVAWALEDMLRDLLGRDPSVASKFYLLEDCSSPVVVPGVVDYTEDADQAYERFAQHGMHIVRSTVPMEEWPGLG
jgi:nicotinamidase-related amidase